MLRQYRKREIKKEISKRLGQHFGIELDKANKEQIYHVCASYVQTQLGELMIESDKKHNKERKVHFICMDFLLGRSLKNHAYNLGMLEELEQALEELGYEPNDIFDVEDDSGLGEGTVGRLAACYGDAAATIGVAGTGYTIRYEKGNFVQKIVNGEQIELEDNWIKTGAVWQTPQFSDARIVHIGGQVEQVWKENGLNIVYKNEYPIVAIPHDMVISGYHTSNCVRLRLWQATSPITPDENDKDYLNNLQKVALAESISKVLYTDISTYEGKAQRLRQQYFLVSATVQDICAKHKQIYGTLENFAQKNVLHLNDTQSAMAVPELMRILLDEEKLSWELAFNITIQSIAYTNHIMRTERDEYWPVDMVRAFMPRIMMLIDEINRRHVNTLMAYYPNNQSKITNMQIVRDGYVFMANLAIIGSFSVNGVSTLHKDMMETRAFPELYMVYPARFRQIVNGVSVRRWLCQANPDLTELITSKIGDGFIKNPSELHVLSGFLKDEKLLDSLAEVKLKNKKRLAEYIFENTGISVDVNTMFDVHCKQVHLHKRHLLYLMHIMTLYYKIKNKQERLMVPRTFIICAKAMPANKIGKKIIRLIHSIQKMVNNDPAVNELLKVVFIENYNVSVAEIVIPAAELSEQLSVTGSEASGTSNMKLMMNGAVTIGTWDGANIEIEKAVGRENIFLFGTQPSQSFTGKVLPEDYDNISPRLKQVLEHIQKGFGDGIDYNDVLDAMFKSNGEIDYYRIAHDYESYCRTHERASQMYLRKQNWNCISLINIANSGRFSADRSVAEYAKNIWRVPSEFSY